MSVAPVIDELAIKRRERAARALEALQVDGKGLSLFVFDLVNTGFEFFEVRFHLITIARWLQMGGTFAKLDGNFVTHLVLDELLQKQILPSLPDPETTEAIAVANSLLGAMGHLEHSF